MSRTPETVHLWGETLCLDYANSVDWSPAGEQLHPDQTDLLRSPDLHGRWGVRAGLLSHKAPPASAAQLRKARLLRDGIYRLFSARSQGKTPAGGDLDLLMASYRDAVAHARLLADGDLFSFDWPAIDPRTIRHAVAADAIALLHDPTLLARVSRCPGRDCGWLFLNVSGRRRWCSMSTCGSRDKMRRHYQRRVSGEWRDGAGMLDDLGGNGIGEHGGIAG